MKIAELVKTYRLLNDPDAPDWSIKFVGGVAIATMLMAGAGAILAAKDPAGAGAAPAAAMQEAAEPAAGAPATTPPECDPARLDREPALDEACAAAAALAQAP